MESCYGGYHTGFSCVQNMQAVNLTVLRSTGERFGHSFVLYCKQNLPHKTEFLHLDVGCKV